MNKFVCVLFSLAFCFFSPLVMAQDGELPSEINPADYLLFFDVRKHLVDKRRVFEGDLNTAAANRVRAADEYARGLKLFEKGAVTQEEKELRRMKSEIANVEFQVVLDELDRNQVEIDLLMVRIAFAAGEPMDVRRLYPVYERQWEVECRLKKDELEISKARENFSEYQLLTYKKLLPTHAVSLEEYQDIETKYIYDSNRRKAKQIVFETCDKDLPSLEELLKLQAHGQSPGPIPPLSLPGLR